MVRSQFEHCSAIWLPIKLIELQKFEAVQKNAIKWILNEEFLSYSDDETYLRKCKQINMLPISKIFELQDLVLFHKIVNGYISFNLPEYIKKFDGASRLRNNHLDSECYICHIDYKQNICASSRNPIFRNYFYRTAHL